MSYIDVFVMSVKPENWSAYAELSKTMAQIWTDHGALAYAEYRSDDVPYGKSTSFPRAVGAPEGEITVIGFATYESREARDAVRPKVMADPRMSHDPSKLPFDARNMIMGGFQSFLES